MELRIATFLLRLRRIDHARVANEIGFGLLPLRSLDSSDAVELAPGAAEESLTATIHTSRLREAGAGVTTKIV